MSLNPATSSPVQMLSNLGKILDPVADKLTQAAMLICLFTRFPHVLLLIVIMAGKELYMVVSGCLVIRKTGKVHGADWHGKIVTFLLYGTAAVHGILMEPLWNGTIAFLIKAVIQLHGLVKNCFI